MAKKKNDNYIADRKEMIKSMKHTEHFYLKQPYRASVIRTPFHKGEKLMVHFFPRVMEPVDYVLEKGEF